MLPTIAIFTTLSNSLWWLRLKYHKQIIFLIQRLIIRINKINFSSIVLRRENRAWKIKNIGKTGKANTNQRKIVIQWFLVILVSKYRLKQKSFKRNRRKIPQENFIYMCVYVYRYMYMCAHKNTYLDTHMYKCMHKVLTCMLLTQYSFKL